jgi:hypothetical protein
VGVTVILTFWHSDILTVIPVILLDKFDLVIKPNLVSFTATNFGMHVPDYSYEAGKDTYMVFIMLLKSSTLNYCSH